MKKIGIYEIVNTANGKRYIGQSVDIQKRFSSHKRSLAVGKHQNEHLQNAFNKYGAESFEFNIIEFCDINAIDEREMFYIKFYGTNDKENGYNKNSGGQARHNTTEETKKRISASNTGLKKPWTEEHKTNASNNWHNVHTPLSEESRERISKTRVERGHGIGEKNVNAIFSDMEALSYIKRFIEGESPYEIAKKEGTSLDALLNLFYNKSYKHLIPEKRDLLVNRCKNELDGRIQKALDLYRNGMSQNKIAHSVGISRNTLRREIENRNISKYVRGDAI